MLKGREILLYLSIKYHGNWNKIYDAIKAKENIKEEDVEKVKSKIDFDYVTLIDNDYPEKLKNSYKPPFVIYYKGKLDLLNNGKLVALASGNTTKDADPFVLSLGKDFTIITGGDSKLEQKAINNAISANLPLVLVCSKDMKTVLSGEEQKLANENGPIISEYGLFADDSEESVIMKSRIIGGLNDALFIASSKKGDKRIASIVATTLQCSAEVYCLPELYNKNSFNNELIKQGATLVDSYQDFLSR